MCLIVCRFITNKHMVVKVFKPSKKPVPKKMGGRHKVVPENQVNGEWGPATFTKQLQCYIINYEKTLEAWAKLRHSTVSTGCKDTLG